MAAGIQDGTGKRAFMTFHPQGGHSSSQWFHNDDWLCCNMIQSGHHQRDSANWQMIGHDYQLSPAKPVLDGEPNYEDHPINWKRESGYFREHDVRKQAYRAVFAGAFGHTYGNQCIWQMYQPGRVPIAFPEFSWRQACDHPGAAQMIHLRNLMLSRPFFSRVPERDRLRGGRRSTSRAGHTRC